MKTRKNKKGISLIVLVITIIVMIILAAAIIISISNSGIVNRANEAVNETNEAQLKQLVTLAWSEAFLKETTEVKNDAYYLKEVANYLKDNGVTDAVLQKYEIVATVNGATLTSKVNEYGFYYDRIYIGEEMMSGVATRFGYVLHEDGSAEYYQEINGAMLCVRAYSANTAIYSKGQAKLGNLEATVSNDGNAFVANGVTANVSEIEQKEIQYGYEYEATVAGETWVVAVDSQNNMTLYKTTASDEKEEETVQITGHGHYIQNSSGTKKAYVSFDGKNIAVEYNGEMRLYTLTSRKQIVHKGIIPEGATYYVGVEGTSGDYTTATATYVAGDPFPETVNVGDIYVYGDYEYRYKMGFVFICWGELEDATGWGVFLAKDRTKTEYEPVLTEINGNPITTMAYTYVNCTNLVVAPKIPNTVTMMSRAFGGCTALTTAPTLPENLQIMYEIFMDCSSLNTYVGSTETAGYLTKYVIPTSVTKLSYAFDDCTSIIATPNWSNLSLVADMGSVCRGCTALTTVTAIPSGVTDLGQAFYGCKSLKAAPSLTKATKLETLWNTFYGCEAMTSAPSTIPSTVKNMEGTFEGCAALTKAPTIPSSVTDIDFTFSGCVNLTGTVTINCTPTSYSGTFYKTVKSIRLAGTCPSNIKELLTYDGTGYNITY